MTFDTTRYEADNGDIHPIRIATNRLSASGAAPAGTITNPIQAKIGKANRSFGLRPRGVVLTRRVGSGDTASTRRTFVPVLQESVYESAAYNPQAELTVNGVTWTVLRRQDEDY